MGGPSGDMPEAPDFQNLATQQTYANRPIQRTPWGRSRWQSWEHIDPATGQPTTRWKQEVSFDPTLEAAYEHQFDRDWHMARLGEKLAMSANQTGLQGRIRDIARTPLSYRGIREVDEIEQDRKLRQRAEDAAYGRATSRLDPQWQERQLATQLRLRNQGLRPGDEAYDREMANLERARTDAYSTARQESTAEGRRETMDEYQRQFSRQAQSAALRQAEIAERLRLREDPYTHMDRIMGLAGRGTSVPQYGFPGVPGAGDYLGAGSQQYQSALDAYNIGQQQDQALMSGLFGLGGNLASAAITAGMFSDRRLKRDITQVGNWRGYPVYTYEYVWGEPGIGVMADEVNADAVTLHPTGFAVVDYSRVR